jgi:hypothetical protein
MKFTERMTGQMLAFQLLVTHHFSLASYVDVNLDKSLQYIKS